MRILKAYLQYKFTAQRITEVSFFEVTTSRSRAVDNGPWYSSFQLSISVSFLLQSLKAYSPFGSFTPFCRPFFKRAQEREVKLRHILYEVWLVSHLLFSFLLWYFRKWITTSIGQSKHMSITCFNPLWVSGFTDSTVFMLFYRNRNSKISRNSSHRFLWNFTK